MTIEVDVAIVGARIAGSVTAALLGAAGYRVLVVDSATFPSDTMSTHFFRGAGLGAVLARLELLDDVLALGSPPLTREYDFRGDDPAPVIEGPQDPGDVGFCLSVRRRPLDHLLVERARATPGVEVWEATSARSLLRDGDCLDAFATFRGAPEVRFAERLAAHPGLAKQFGRSSPEGRMLGSGPKDAIVRTPAGPGWALVGDASLSQDPWTGLGMDNAGTHAVFLSEAVDAWLSGRSSETEAFAEYRRRRDEHAMPGFVMTADQGRDLSVLAAG